MGAAGPSTARSSSPSAGLPAGPDPQPRRWRTTLVVLGALALLGAASGLALSALATWGRSGPVEPGDALAATAATLAAALCAWLAACALVVCGQTLGRRTVGGGTVGGGTVGGGTVGGGTVGAPRLGARPVPPLVRHAVAVLLGVSVLAPATATAAPPRPAAVEGAGSVAADADGGARQAAHPGPAGDPDPAAPPGPAAHPHPAPPDLHPGWTPEAPPAAPRPTAPGLLTPLPREAALPADDEVVVRCGDTLWDLAARALPGTPSDAEIAAAWPLWHAANADVVGPDPDRLLPGQRLRVPAAATGTGADR